MDDIIASAHEISNPITKLSTYITAEVRGCGKGEGLHRVTNTRTKQKDPVPKTFSFKDVPCQDNSC